MANRKTNSKLALRLGENIARERKRRGWTQAQLAEKLGGATETVSRFERGSTMPSLVTLERLSQALRVTLADLLSANSNEPAEQAATIQKWLSELSAEDRMYVTEMVRRACDHLR